MFNLRFLTFLVIIAACKEHDYFKAPVVTEADRPFADVFKPWDGIWKGTFYIYNDTGFANQPPSPKEFQDRAWDALILLDSIRVTQNYQSESPYFQKVRIRDHYPDRIEESIGVNKVEDGQLWCIVKKPNELVFHKGARETAGTLIWNRDERSPLRKEYFFETATDSTYSISGWGYYEGDSLTLGPRTWFRANYTKE